MPVLHGLSSRKALTALWRMVLALGLALVARESPAQQPANTIASFPGVRGLATFQNLDDQYWIVLVGVSDGTLHELFYTVPPNSVPASHGDSVIATFDQPIIAVTGFYAQDEGYRIAIVATPDGSIHEVFYHPDRGRGESIVGSLDNIVAIAAFFNEDDKYRVILAATRDGQLHEIYYHPDKGRGESVIAAYPGVRALSGFYDRDTGYRTAIVVTDADDGTLNVLQYHPRKPRIVSRDRVYVIANSVASAPWSTVLVTTNSTLYFCQYQINWHSPPCASSGSVSIDGLQQVAFGVGSSDTGNLVYTTSDGAVHQYVYVARPPNPPLPELHVAIKASPSNYINAGDSTTLERDVSNCVASCAVQLEARHGFNYSVVAWSRAGLSTTNSLKVTPSQQNTRYTLSASGPTGSSSARVDVALYYAPGPCSGCGWYFFRVNGPAPGNFCSTVVMYAQSAAMAKTLVEQQNQGYTVTTITEPDYYAGCP